MAALKKQCTDLYRLKSRKGYSTMSSGADISEHEDVRR
jgi:hypothetical protein